MMKLIKRSMVLVFSILYTGTYCNTLPFIVFNNEVKTNSLPIKTGADNYAKYLPLLKGKKVGIVTNQTGILSDNTHLVDFLLEKKVDVCS